MKPVQLLSPREQFQCHIAEFKNQLSEIEDMVNIMEENEELLFQIGQAENVLVKSQIALSNLKAIFISAVHKSGDDTPIIR